MNSLPVWVALTFTTTTSLTRDEIAAFTTNGAHVEKYSGSSPEVSVETDAAGEVVLIKFNAIPDHYTGQWDGQNEDFNLLKSQDLRLLIRKTPKRANTVLWCLPLGMIGVTVKGVPIYNPYIPVKGCKNAKTSLYLDACRGRTDENGVYHYYDYSPCVQSFKCNQPGQIYGVAIDGYPIYGPYDEQGVLLTSRNLDECGGRLDNYGMYKYHIVMDQPNFMYCLKGQIDKSLAHVINIDNFVCNCPYTDSHFKAPKPICEEEEPTTAIPIMEDEEKEIDFDPIPGRDCLTPEMLEERYTDTMWGDYNVSRVERVCNFSNPQNTVICQVNETLWQKRPSWVYKETAMLTLPCCPKAKSNNDSDSGESCQKTCFVNRDVSKDNLNPKCQRNKIEILSRDRVMVPNSSLNLGGWRKLSGLILLSILGTLLLH